MIPFFWKQRLRFLNSCVQFSMLFFFFLNGNLKTILIQIYTVQKGSNFYFSCLNRSFFVHIKRPRIKKIDKNTQIQTRWLISQDNNLPQSILRVLVFQILLNRQPLLSLCWRKKECKVLGATHAEKHLSVIFAGYLSAG